MVCGLLEHRRVPSVLTDGKPAVLVVMHHTFDPRHVVAESRRQVNDTRVWLTVDCLFYQKNLLPCPLNDIMQKQVADFLGSSSGSLVRRLLLTRRPHNVVAEMRDVMSLLNTNHVTSHYFLPFLQVPFWKNTTFRKCCFNLASKINHLVFLVTYAIF